MPTRADMIAESDRYTVYQHIGGDHHGYRRIVAAASPYAMITGTDGKLKEGDDTLWLTPRLVAGPVADLEHCLEIWLRETVYLSAEGTARVMPWLVNALKKDHP